MFKTRKVVIVGAGHVGSHVALALIQSGEADDIVLIDIPVSYTHLTLPTTPYV